MSNLIKEINEETLAKIKEDAWLNILVNEHTLYNPLENIPHEYHEDPHLYLTYLMSRPEYFSFVCSEILNIEIFPFQSVILKEMWTHKFPMLVASRGASKCVHYDTTIITNKGIKKIGDLVTDHRKNKRNYYTDLKVYGEQGWEDVDYAWYNGLKDTVVIRLENGMSLESTLNHPIKKVRGSSSEWIHAENVEVGDEILLKSPQDFNSENHYSEDYIELIAKLTHFQREVPDSVWKFSKGALEIYFQKLTQSSTFSSKRGKKLYDLQLLYFYATGNHARIKNDKLTFTNKKLTSSKVKFITKSKTETYDIHTKGPSHSFISNGLVSHNSYTLALYALLRAILLPGRKVIIVGSVFRQSKVIFNYLTKMYNGSPLIRDANNCKEPKMYPDRCELEIGESLITALPIGCLSTDTLITTSDGIRYMGDYYEKPIPEKIWSKDSFKELSFFYDNGFSDCKKITTNLGYNFTSTPNHKMKIVRNNEIIWCRADEMVVGDDILIDISDRWFNPTFKASIDDGYALGCMIGDGSYVRNDRLQFTTKDEEFLSVLNKTIGEFKPQKDGLHYYMCKSNKVKEWMDFWGLGFTYTIDKKMPENLLSCDKDVVANCIAGIFDTDGHVFTSEAKGGTSISINFTTISEKLARQLHYIFLHFGIQSSLRHRDRKHILRGKEANTNTTYELMISGPEVVKFYEKIPIRLSRKKKELENAINSKKKFNAIKNAYVPVDKKLLTDIAKEYNLGHRLHVKDIERKKSITKPYLEKFLSRCRELNIENESAKTLEVFLDNNIAFNKITKIEDVESVYTVDLNVPENNTYTANGFISHNTGESIRGYRSNDTICDEFAAQSQEIFETVIAGFGSVSQSPVKNAKEAAAINLLKAMNQPMDLVHKDEFNKDNQIILTGSAYYYFNHFAQYWEKWRGIIYSRGIQDKLYELFHGDVPPGFNWADYSVLRLPVELLPPGFMDEGQIARSRATMTPSIYEMEFSAVFSKDSDGFFKASSIENATANHDNNIILPSSPNPIIFEPKVKGDPGRQYVMGVDPASEVDNFSIVIEEIHSDHNRVVYCWTTNAKKFKKKLQKGLIKNKDYYGFCARKIRNLMKRL